MDSRQSKSIHHLTESIYSLLGLTPHLTSSWADSVCEIVNNLPSDEPSDYSKIESEDNSEDELGTAIAKIEDELAALTACISQLSIQRRQVLNDFLDLKGNARVYCRVRPITPGENLSRLRLVEALDSSRVLLNFAENKSKIYTFNRVFHSGSSQDEVYSEIEPVIKSALDGYNACIFAYGQTGAGKTFTMEGTPDNPGVVPRAIESLFKQADDSNRVFLFSFSMLEIYLGNLKDLLFPPSRSATDPMPPCLTIQTDPKGGIEINNLVTIQVSNFKQALSLYQLGCRFRSTASTNSNRSSSRSHCMIRISMTCFDAPERQRETNKIWMVDLGGSEHLLKTNALGRRLEEGKAINLSLSALGDVINALQRKKYHIPYRNSKLTRVLKDSLGGDSKILMLVHVSSKEEDLCETVCSLNFATRVRSIHLANEETTAVRFQKEVAISNLQQKMKKIEDERQDIRRDIEKLNKRLENLTRVEPSSGEPLDASHIPIGVSQSKTENMNMRIGDVKAAPLSQLPRFMRPTICSRKKSRIDNRTSEDRFPVHAEKRRLPSHRAESETFPVKVISEYNSECRISRTSRLMGFNMKCSADNETEYSRGTSECDIKTVVFPDKGISPSSSGHQKAHLSHSEENRNKRTNKVNSTEFMKVNNWLHLHKNEPNTWSYSRRNKQVLAIPTQEKKNRCGQNNAETLHDKEVHNHEFTKKKVVNHDKFEKLSEVEVAGRSISEIVTERKPVLLKDLFGKDSRSNSISPSLSVDDRIKTQTQGLADSLLIEDKNCSFLSQLDIYNGFNNKYLYGVNGMSTMQVLAHKKDSLLHKDGCGSHFSPSDKDNSIVDLTENSGLYISKSELELRHQQVLIEMAMEDNENEDLDAYSQQLHKGMRPRLQKMRSQRALFMGNANQKDLTMFLLKSQGDTQNSGICDLLKQKIQSLCASALLGLGFQNLGLEHDFFYGLML